MKGIKLKQVVATTAAPSAIGTYSQAIACNGMVFISGQIPVDPQTNQICEGDFATRVKRVIDNIRAVAEAAGGSLNDVVKLNVSLTNMDDFPILNTVMEAEWPQPYPARAAVAVSALPKAVDIEIEAIMMIDE